MSQIEVPGQRSDLWERVGDATRRVGRLEAVRNKGLADMAVWGALFNDGTIIAGTGFAASDDGLVGGVEQYTVTFDTPFVNPPVVAITPNNNNGPGGSTNGRYTATLYSRTNTEIVVITANIDDPDSLGPQDGGFDFLAVEPGV